MKATSLTLGGLRASSAARPGAVRLPPADAGGLRGRRAGPPRRTGARTGRRRGAAGHRPGPGGGRPSAARRSIRCAAAGLEVVRLRRRRGKPDQPARRGRRATSPARSSIDLIVAVGGGSSMDCAKGINFLLTNGGADGRLQGLRQGDEADAAVDRRADHGRHRQRGPVVRPDRRREDAPENGLRRPQGRLPRRHPRPGSDRLAAAPR